MMELPRKRSVELRGGGAGRRLSALLRCAGRIALLAGSAVLAATAGLAIGPRPVQATECANAGAQTTAPNDGTLANNTACGNAASAVGAESTALGNGANATNVYGTAVGASASATSDGTVAVGHGASASGFLSTAVGDRSVASATNSIAIGQGATASAQNSVTVGGFAVGADSTAIGRTSFANGAASTAIGNSSFADGAASTAVGNLANATAANSTAIGANSSATFANSTAIGNGAAATRSNQQMFGTAINTYSMAGITSAASAAAQSGPRQVVTSDSSGNLATSSLAGLGIASSTDIAALQSQINGLVHRDQQLTSGIAISLALAQPMLQAGQTVGVRVGWGNFGGSNAVALSAAGVVARGFAGPTTSLVVDAGIGLAASQTGGRVGVTLGW